MSTSKIWSEELRELVLHILSEPKTVYGYTHRPYMTTYQIALAVKKHRPDIFEAAKEQVIIRLLLTWEKPLWTISPRRNQNHQSSTHFYPTTILSASNSRTM